MDVIVYPIVIKQFATCITPPACRGWEVEK